MRSQFCQECVNTVAKEFVLFRGEIARREEFGSFRVHSVAGEEFETGSHDFVKCRLRLELFVVEDRLSEIVYEVVLSVSSSINNRRWK